MQTSQLVTRKGPEGSNPSPGAHLEEISTCFKTDGCKRETQSVEAGMRRRVNDATSFNKDITVVTVVAVIAPTEEKLAETEGQEDQMHLAIS